MQSHTHMIESSETPSQTIPSNFSQYEKQTLRRLMAQFDVFLATTFILISSSNFAHTSIYASVFSTSSSYTPQIIDSEVTNHITSFFVLLSSYSGRDKVNVTDESLSSMSRKGSIMVQMDVHPQTSSQLDSHEVQSKAGCKGLNPNL